MFPDIQFFFTIRDQKYEEGKIKCADNMQDINHSNTLEFKICFYLHIFSLFLSRSLLHTHTHSYHWIVVPCMCVFKSGGTTEQHKGEQRADFSKCSIIPLTCCWLGQLLYQLASTLLLMSAKAMRRPFQIQHQRCKAALSHPATVARGPGD